MFGCKCKCECDLNKRLIELKIDHVKRMCDFHRNWDERFNQDARKTLYALLEHLNLEIIPSNEKEKVPEIQFRKRNAKRGK